ncbi:MAG: hypothetical protein ACKVZH_19675 [Blastocatellia bacterium]
MSEVTTAIFSQGQFSHSGSFRVATNAQAKSKSGKLILALVMVIGGFYLATIRTGHYWGDDFSVYLQHAQNIAQGAPYSASSYLYLPPYVGPDSYPPIFPLLLTPVVWLFGVNFTAMKVVNILAFAAALLLLIQIVKDSLPVTWQVALVALVGFNPYFWNFKDNVVSEVPFLVTAYLSIWLVQRFYESGVTGWAKFGYVLATGISFYLAYGTRSIGLVLLPCLALYDLIRNRKPTLFAAGVVVVTIVLAVFQSYLLRSDRNYVEMVQPGSENFFYNWMIFILKNTVLYTTSLTEIWDNGYAKIPRLGLTIVMSGLAIIGYATQLRKRITFVEIFVGAYTVSIVIVPMTGGLRYLLPVVPFYVFYSLQGIRALPMIKPLRRRLVTAIAVFIVVAYVANYSKHSFGVMPDGIAKAEAVEFFDYVNRQTTERDVIIFSKPRALALFTGKKSSFFPLMLEDKQIWEYFKKIQATHIVVGPNGVEPFVQEFFTKFVGKYQVFLKPEYSNADFQVYRITGLPSANANDAGEFSGN